MYNSDFALSLLGGIDFVNDYAENKLVFLQGKINIQAWAPITSTETRLIIDSNNNFKTKDYGNFNDYEDRFYYYNNIERSFGLHINDNHDHTLGFDLCADCSLENKLWKNYLSKYKSNLTVKELVIKLSQNTKRSLLKDNHGKLFNKQNPEMLLETIEQYNTTRK